MKVSQGFTSRLTIVIVILFVIIKPIIDIITYDGATELTSAIVITAFGLFIIMNLIIWFGFFLIVAIIDWVITGNFNYSITNRIENFYIWIKKIFLKIRVYLRSEK